MSSFFLDTSALVKLYVREPGSEAMIALVTSDEGHALAILSITGLELRSALRRRERAGDVSSEDAERVIERSTSDFERRYERVRVNDRLIERASSLVDRHSLRAYDALQLAGCLEWKGSGRADAAFVCSDSRLLEAAVAESLATLDPAKQKKAP